MGNIYPVMFEKMGISRRDFLRLTSISCAGILAGCAIDPVTGKRQLMLMSEEQEIDIDKKSSPHQFSADYGSINDRALNNYIDRTGKKMAKLSHRPQMPYSFQGVNATYVNAYAFPAGSIATTRGILLELENEAELAGLLGHEIGHVNGRHTAERMTKGMLTNLAVSGLVAAVSVGSKDLAPLAAGLGGIGAGVLLASYSRDDEREADSLGMKYMVGSGHNPNGMIGLMDVLMNISKHKPSAIDMMFSTHPMSEERHRTASKRSKTQYGSAKNLPLNRDRYMDHTVGLRKIRGAIEKMQNGEKYMAKREFNNAETQFKEALKKAPQDYAGLLMMSKCQLVQKKYDESKRYASLAKRINPKEAQAYHVNGMAKIMKKEFSSAYGDFADYEKMLPGNPNTTFFKGYSLEGMQKIRDSANEYAKYLKFDNRSKQAKHAYTRLVEWGYVKPRRK